MILNGASLRFHNKTRIELTAQARFLFGKQVMRPEQADSPAKRIYFAMQTAYIGTEEERSEALAQARDLIAAFKVATTSGLACEILDTALAQAEADQCYEALKLIRRIMQHEAAVAQLAAGSPVATALAAGSPVATAPSTSIHGTPRRQHK